MHDATPAAAAQSTPAGSPDGRRSRWTAHRAQRREAFVVAGVAALDRHGPAASAEQIAAEAGVSRSVLYRYFRDKDDLHKAISDRIVGEVIDSVLPHLMITPQATPRGLISAAIGVIIGWLDEHPNLYYFLRERRSGPIETVETTLADRIAGLLKMLMMFFGIEDDEAEPGAYGIVGFVESAGAWWLNQRRTERTMSRERFTASVCLAVWHLLEGTARANGITIAYDEPLPAALFGGPGGAG